VLQVLVNSVIYASEIAIMAVGVSLTFAVLRFANFAHVQFAVVGGYLTYVFTIFLGVPIAPAALVAAVLTGGLAMLVDFTVFRRLRDISPEGKMIVSWGVALFIRSIVAAVFGGSSRVFALEPPTISFAGAYFTWLDIVCVVATVVAMLVLHALLYRTRVGTALRALSSNRDLAVTRGIPGERMIALMWFISGFYAALGGALFAAETRLQPNMDLIILLPIFAAVTIGGLGNVFGAVVGALILSLAQNLLISIDFGSLLSGTPWYVPTQFRDFIAVGALVVLLLLRPGTLFGRAAR
jgi:branched-subunit amino acid ABC-type transport system permease component